MKSTAHRFSPASSTAIAPSEDAVNDMVLSLTLLGEFTLRDENGVELSLPTRKTRALLAFLALNADRPQRRERLMTLLWSDRGEQQARQSLNQALRAIRKTGEQQGLALLDSGSEHATLRGDALESDAHRFRSLLDEAPAEAADLYTGLLLDGLSIAEPAFADWLAAMRAEMHALACSALARAADAAAEAGENETAINRAARLVSLDPLREEAHRRLMRLLHESGDRAAALRQYRSLAELLEKELQVEPDAATKALYDAIRQDSGTTAEPKTPAPSSNAARPLPEKPSIAVLPFVNLSGDPEQEIFADGMADDIITELSRFHSLFVIARGSSFSFKDQPLDVRTIAAKLGVRYILEGSVRIFGSRLRVTAQLIDAETEDHIWAERYDREIEDTFAVQDELTNAIVRAIAPQIDRIEHLRAERKPPENIDAWTLYQRGLAAYYTSTEPGLRSAAALFDQATALDTSFATAYGYAAASRNRLVLNFGVDDADTLLAEVEARLNDALALDPQDIVALFVSGVQEALRGHHELAIAHVERAISLNPNSAYTHGILGFVLRQAGRPAEAIDAVDRALHLSPFDPATSMFLQNRAAALFELGHFEESVEWARRAISVPGAHRNSYLWLVAALVCLDRCDEACEMWNKLTLRYPRFSLASTLRGRDKSRATGYRDRDEILRKAGFGN